MAIMEKALDAHGLGRVWDKFMRKIDVLGGATTAEEALKNLGAMGEMELLWENASSTSAFAPQNINMDLSNYSMLGIVFMWTKDLRCRTNTFLCKIPETGGIAYMASEAGAADIETGPSLYGNAANAARSLAVYPTYVRFDSAALAKVSAYANNNNMMIPYQIYGIKNALKAA